ncbi:MAG: sensor histidine kinase [Ktedonobacteraceae bacterium]
MFNSYESKTDTTWRSLRLRLSILYLVIALILLLLSVAGNYRLLSQVGHTFGGFFWAIDTDKQIVVVSTPPQLPPIALSPGSLTSLDHIVKVNGQPALEISNVYQHTSPGHLITYTVQQNDKLMTFMYPAITFTQVMWFESYGLTFIAGICWILVGFILLVRATNWTGAVEGITLIPVAILFLLFSHWGNVQLTYPADLVFQFLWTPAFALLGAAFIQLSLTYRPEAMRETRSPRMTIDVIPYLPLVGLLAFDIFSYLLHGSVPGRLQFILSLGYAVFGGILSLIIGITSLLRISGVLPGSHIPSSIRRRLGDLLTLWIGGVGLGFCLGILPILFTGKPLIPLQIFYILAAIYPFILLYALRSLRMIDFLQYTIGQREQSLVEQQQLTEELRKTNSELQQATSLLLDADAHLRSLLSQRIHDQPKQQALRIRSLLSHWQHKLRVEAEQNSSVKNFALPIIEALGKIRKISEELESDLRGLQLLVEDAYQRRSLGIKLHLEKLIREDLPHIHPESPLNVQADLWVLDELSYGLEQTPAGEKFAEAISYTVTQTLLNIYNHAGASFATVRALRIKHHLEIYITDDGRGFDPGAISPEKTSLFKAQLKVREAGGTLTISSVPRSQPQHGTTIILRLPFPDGKQPLNTRPLPGFKVPEK